MARPTSAELRIEAAAATAMAESLEAATARIRDEGDKTKILGVLGAETLAGGYRETADRLDLLARVAALEESALHSDDRSGAPDKIIDPSLNPSNDGGHGLRVAADPLHVPDELLGKLQEIGDLLIGLLPEKMDQQRADNGIGTSLLHSHVYQRPGDLVVVHVLRSIGQPEQLPMVARPGSGHQPASCASMLTRAPKAP